MYQLGNYIIGKKLTLTAFLILIFIISGIQCYSLWLPVDEKIDEGELVYFAVGFFGLDFDPHWYTYGSFGMYILYAWYLLLYVFQFLAGNTNSLDEYARQLFYNEYFIDSGRYLFTLFGVLTVVIYTVILHRVLKLKIAWVFFILSVTAGESLYFANYIRTDQLASLLIACLIYSYLFLARARRLYTIALISAALVTTKISTAALGALLAYIIVKELLFTRQLSAKHLLGVVIVFGISSFVFQPFHNPISALIEAGAYLDDPVLGGLKRLDKLQLILEVTYKHITENVSWWFLYLLPLLIFTQKSYRPLLAISLVTVLLLLLPFSFGSGIVRNYWLIPVYDIFRFLAVFSLANALELLTRNSAVARYQKMFCLILALLICFPLYSNVEKMGASTRHNAVVSNKQLAKKWINMNLIGFQSVLLDTHFNHALPKIYHPNFISQSKQISRVFYYNRDQNMYLNAQFEAFLESTAYAYQKINPPNNMTAINYLKKQGSFDIRDSSSITMVEGNYFITSPSVYGRMMNKASTKSGNGYITINESKITSYYQFMLQSAPVKVFDQGSGPSIEIYKIEGGTVGDTQK